MPNEILSLGLPQETVNALASYLCARFYVAHNLAEVSALLDSHEICYIVVNAASCPNPVADVTSLLGHTPLTTRIILLYNPAAGLDLGKLKSMGIKTLATPYEVGELAEKLRR